MTDTETPETETTTTPEAASSAGSPGTTDQLAADAEAAFDASAPEREAEAETPVIRREGPGGEAADMPILTEAQFFDMFRLAFDGPQAVMPAFRHIAIDNGQPFRPEAARATSDRLYRLCRRSGIRWLENLLAVDQSGLQTLIDLGLVGWFLVGTGKGAALALDELRNGDKAADEDGDQDAAEPAEDEVTPGTFTHTLVGKGRAN